MRTCYCSQTYSTSEELLQPCANTVGAATQSWPLPLHRRHSIVATPSSMCDSYRLLLAYAALESSGRGGPMHAVSALGDMVRASHHVAPPQHPHSLRVACVCMFSQPLNQTCCRDSLESRSFVPEDRGHRGSSRHSSAPAKLIAAIGKLISALGNFFVALENLLVSADTHLKKQST